MTDETSAICSCGHDDLTHAMKLVSVGGVLGGVMGECYASVPGWECRCPKFTPEKSAAEIRAAVESARLALETGAMTDEEAFG